ncbi:MAG: hypothetical protein IPM22_17670 [Betaproteobacteria bacterium]|nr:hypothetical protein [Betaproteobacteria bacterium]MCC7217784.1 hypothetical protein [Burkholderiales bacterium]
MVNRNLIAGVAVAWLMSACATLEPMPFANAKDCFYPACSLDVEVVDDGKGGKKLKVEGDGNVRMGTRHRLVAIVWNLKTPGYEFRGDSVLPHTGATARGMPANAPGAWSQTIVPHGYWYDSISVTSMNTERRLLNYDLTVYPASGTPGDYVTANAAILNDPCPYSADYCR